MLEEKRILVTGATGFVGRALTRRLVTEGARVVALGRRSCGIQGVEDAIVSATTTPDLRNSLGHQEFDLVFHLAAAGVAPVDRELERLFAVNVQLGCALLETTEAGAYVFAGSSAEYARKDRAALCETDPLRFEDPYGASKAAGGLTHCAFAHALGKPLAVLRLFHVYGTGEPPHRLTTALFGKLRRGEKVALTEGSQVRDFLYLEDALDAFLVAAESQAAGRLATGPYNVSTGKGKTIREACLCVARLLDAAPELLDFGALPLRENESPSVVGDNTKFRTATEWHPRFTLEDGLRNLRDIVGSQAAVIC